MGKGADSFNIISEASHLHPENATLKLALGNCYLMALFNEKGWAPDIDPGPMILLTLDTLSCDYKTAASAAECSFRDAIDISNDSRITAQAREQLRTLKAMDSVFGINGNK